MLALALIALSLHAAPAPVEPHALQVLREQCLLAAADVKNPWALAHGVKLFGPTYLAADGRRAVEVIIHDFLQKNPSPTSQAAPYGFQRFAADGTPIEPHTNLNVKAFLVEGKLPLSTTFTASFGPVTLKQLVDGIKRSFRHVPGSPEYWRDVAWTLEIIAATEKPGASLATSDGKTVSVDQVFDDALTELEKETADLKAGLDAHLPQVDKRKQGLYAHPCGGLHFVQAVLGWARNPSVRKRWGARVDAQVALHFYRLESEHRQYDAAYVQAQKLAPELKLRVLTQQVKFYGHFLETAARFRDDFGWKPDAGQVQQLAVAKALLDATVRELESLKAFEQLEALKKSQPQVALDLVGDGCHAAHGLAAWR
jgi:hypothetical protein